MKNIGIIDLGSNSVRLMIVGVADDGSYKLLDEAKESVRLSEHMGAEATLKPAAIERTIAALRLFQHLCRAYGVTETIAVATAAVRQATNQGQFLQQVYEATGLRVRVFSGMEEAQAVHIGVANTLDAPNGLIVDIGGGSTEIILMQDRQLIQAISLPYGAVNLTETVLEGHKLSDEQIRKLEDFLRSQFAAIPWLTGITAPVLIGIGGTIRNLSKIDRKRKKYSLSIMHNYRMKCKDASEIYRQLRGQNLEQRKKTPGLSRDRADIIVAGSAIVHILSEMTQAKEMIVSGSGLRDGLWYQHLLRHQAVPLVDNVLQHSVNNILRYYHMETGHSCHVAHLTLSMFDQLQPLHGLGSNERKVLEVASLLHDVGIQVNYYEHYKHSFYLIANSRINGLTHREIIMAAFVAAAHTKPLVPSPTAYRDILSEEDWKTLRKLSIILRIAESLDRSEAAVIQDLRCHQHVGAVHLIAITSVPAELEVFDACKVASDFKKVFDHNLIISAQPPGIS
ncbi:exopolyphosphatase [Heliophilum fasciatum]|uniref:Exopolyphosphatase n=1 Tax=Heliophilum fasciatum TaxID=35700 RepID=A0A4R2RPC0_9FIRM|nr:exopolyphosphatase [Heliophilum fasciatum]MCW2277595.1 exopolyphosphatase/guanosine-5'-triphosphate,3'-diphosphate pyrophosphatase [Heliophilum fasciatum]TCP64944.1 Ppx/GppA phosphatase [Heliophilum fasciatum]